MTDWMTGRLAKAIVIALSVVVGSGVCLYIFHLIAEYFVGVFGATNTFVGFMVLLAFSAITIVVYATSPVEIKDDTHDGL